METSVKSNEVVSIPFYPFVSMPGLLPWLRANAFRWLELGDLVLEKDFYKWASDNGLWVLPIPEGVILLTNWQDGVSVVIHPVLTDKNLFHDSARVRKILAGICDLLQVTRIEARLLSTVGPTLRRWMREYGFTHEGTLRSSTIDWTKPEHPLISMEIWAILKMELLEV